MCIYKASSEDVEKIREGMMQKVNMVCDQMYSKDEEQVNSDLEKLEEELNETSLEVVIARCQENNQESVPLLLEQQQELRKRVYSGVHPEDEGPGFTRQDPGPEQDLNNMSPEVQKPGEGFCERVLRKFQKMLDRLQKTWEAMLTWVKETFAPFYNAVKCICSAISSLCASMKQFFSSSLQA